MNATPVAIQYIIEPAASRVRYAGLSAALDALRPTFSFSNVGNRAIVAADT